MDLLKFWETTKKENIGGSFKGSLIRGETERDGMCIHLKTQIALILVQTVSQKNLCASNLLICYGQNITEGHQKTSLRVYY